MRSKFSEMLVDSAYARLSIVVMWFCLPRRRRQCLRNVSGVIMTRFHCCDFAAQTSIAHSAALSLSRHYGVVCSVAFRI